VRKVFKRRDIRPDLVMSFRRAKCQKPGDLPGFFVI
jgi:hypothetical protein